MHAIIGMGATFIARCAAQEGHRSMRVKRLEEKVPNQAGLEAVMERLSWETTATRLSAMWLGSACTNSEGLMSGQQGEGTYQGQVRSMKSTTSTPTTMLAMRA